MTEKYSLNRHQTVIVRLSPEQNSYEVAATHVCRFVAGPAGASVCVPSLLGPNRCRTFSPGQNSRRLAEDTWRFRNNGVVLALFCQTFMHGG